MRRLLAPLAAALALAAIVSAASAQVPREVPYQGTLADNGDPVTAPTDVTFRLYEAPSGGTPVWFETQTVLDEDQIRGMQSLVRGVVVSDHERSVLTLALYLITLT